MNKLFHYSFVLISAAVLIVCGFFVADTARAVDTWDVNNSLYPDDSNCITLKHVIRYKRQLMRRMMAIRLMWRRERIMKPLRLIRH